MEESKLLELGAKLVKPYKFNGCVPTEEWELSGKVFRRMLCCCNLLILDRGEETKDLERLKEWSRES